MKEYKITVVVPTYNTGDALYYLFNSIKAQTIGFENIEVIFVDDNSPDKKTIAILKELETYENVTTIYLKDNSGFPGRGRNIGLKKAKGEYIIFSDHDDSYNKDAFEVMYNKVTSKKGDSIFTNFYRVFPDKKIPPLTNFDGKTIEIDNIEEDLRILSLIPAIWAKLFRREFLIENNIKFLEGMLAEDLELFVHTTLLSNKIIYLDGFYSYNYSIRDTDEDKSTIHLRSKLIYDKMIDGYYKTYDLLVRLKKTKYFDVVFKYHFIFFITSLITSNLSDKDKKELLISINPLLKKEFEYCPNLDERIYTKLTSYLQKDEFNKAIMEIKKLRLRRKIKGKVEKFLSLFS